MSNNPANSADLGSAFATVGYIYKPDGMQQFVTAARQGEQTLERIAQAQQRLATLSFQPATGQINQFHQSLQQIGTTAERVRAILNQRGALGLTEQAQQSREALDKLEHKAESLRAKIAAIGIDPSKLRSLLDTEGRVRETVQVRAGNASFAEQQRRTLQRDFGRVASVNAADSRFEALLKDADPGTRLADADDINAAKALVEETARYADDLKRVEAQQRSMERSSSGNRQSRSIEEATAALHDYEHAIERATTAQRSRAQAEQRIAQLQQRERQLSSVAATAAPESERQSKAEYVATVARIQLTEAQKRYTEATQTATQATQQQAAAESRLLAIEERLTGIRQPTTTIRVQDVSDRSLQLEAERQRTAEISKQTAELQRQGQLEAAQANKIATIHATDAAKQAQIAVAQQNAAARLGVATQRVEQARIQGTARVEVAERQSAARIQAAQLSSAAMVERTRIQSSARLEAQEKRIQAQQDRAARSSQYPLPRTFAGFTGGGLVQALGAAGIITSFDQVIGKAVELGQESTALAKRAETIGPAYEDAAAKAGVASDELLQKLKIAARGTISETNIQVSANRALLGEITTDSQQLADLLTIARERGKRLGVDTEEAFRRIVEGIGKNETELLDELQILPNSEQAYKAYAESIGVSVNELTKQQKALALTNDIIAKNQDLLRESGQAALDNADLQAQAEVRRQEALTRLGKSLLPAQTALAGTGADIFELISGQSAERTRELDDQLLRSSESFEQYETRVNAVNQAIAAGIGQISKQLFGIDVLPDVLSNKLSPAIRSEFELRKEIEAADGELLNYEANLRQSAAAHKNHANAATVDADAQKSFRQAIVQGNRDLEAAQERRIDALEQLEESHRDRVAGINEQLSEARTSIAERDQQQAAERQRADLRSQRQYLAEQASAYAEYQQRRAELVEQQQERAAERDRQEQRDRLEAEQSANVSLLRSRADFLSQINQLSNRGGRTGQQTRRDALIAEQRAVQEAQALAAETGDSAAAAELLEQRRRQILQDIEAKREAQQRTRDARSGGSLSSETARTQLEEERAAQQAVNDAEIQLIKDGAYRRQQEREEERQQQQQSDAQALTDLDTSYAEQRRKAAEARAEQLREEAQDRALADQQRRVDDEKNIQRIEASLTKEQAAYEKSRADVESEYTKSLDRIHDQLNERTQELFFPDQTEQAKLLESYKGLADQIGSAFVEQIKARLSGSIVPGDADLGIGGTAATPPTQQGGKRGPGLQAPLAGGQRTYQRGSRVGQPGKDRVLSDQGIDQLVQGGVQTDGFSSGRASTGTHQGIDIAAAEGTPIKSPITGTVRHLDDHPIFGKRVTITAGDGSRWYFGHLSRAAVADGRQVERGQTVGYVGHSGEKGIGNHVHVQYNPGGGGTLDPTATLERLASSGSSSTPRAAALPTSRLASRATGAASSSAASGSFAAGIPAADSGALVDREIAQIGRNRLLDHTVAQPSGPVTIDRKQIIDFRGAVFEAGVSMEAVEQAVRRGADAIYSQRQSDEDRAFERLAASGAYQPL